MGRGKCVFLGIFSILSQFTLAILGEGGFLAFFSVPAIRWVTVATVGISTAGFFADSNISSGVKEDRGNRWVMMAFGGIAILLTFFSAYTDREDFLTIDGDTTRWVGLAVYVLGAVVRLWPCFVLGKRFSGLVAIQEGHKLETHGIYAKIRNPSYLGMLINSAGWALVFRSGVGLVLAACFLIPLVARMHAEERLLSQHFGSEYDSYFKRTWRLLPWVY